MNAQPVTPAGPLLGLDLGARRVGVAVSGALEIAHPLGFLDAKPQARLLERLAQLARCKGCVRIVVGLPLNMDGSEGPAARAARALGAEIARATGLPVDYSDERLTSFAAERSLAALNLTRGKRKGRVDAVAAALMLEGYLAERREGGPATPPQATEWDNDPEPESRDE